MRANADVANGTNGLCDDRRLLRRSLGYGLLAVGGFLAAAVAVNLAINRLAIRPAAPQPFASKLSVISQAAGHREPFTVLFLGSSRFHHGIDPAVFDRETARLGLRTRTFNLGVDALNFPETLFLADKIFEQTAGRNIVLVVEPSLRARLAPGLETSERALGTHDLAGSLRVFRLVLDGNVDWQRKLFWTASHARVSAVRLTNIGVLTGHFIREAEPSPDLAELLGPAGDGFFPLLPEPGKGLPVTVSQIAQVIATQKEAERAGTARRLNDFEIGVLAELRRKAEAAGATLILLTPPTADADIFGEFSAVAAAKAAGKIDAPVFSFADPTIYPDLYAADGFYDPDHLKAAQADAFTLRAARAMAADLSRLEKTKTDMMKSGKEVGDAVH